MMNQLFDEMSGLFAKGDAFVLATVVSRNGSAPRSAGARMVVQADGSTRGTIGGGTLEAQVEELARQVNQTHQPVLKSFLFSGTDAATMDAICGGEVEVLIEWMDSGDENLAAVVKGLQEALTRRKKVWMVTRLEGGDRRGIAALIQVDGKVLGKLPEGMDAQAVTSKGMSNPGGRHVENSAQGHLMIGRERVMVEPLDSGKTVYIYGAGHVSRSLAEFTQAVGFHTVVLDDRADYANRERFPLADEVVVLDGFNDAVNRDAFDPDCFIVIITRGHLHDRTVLAQALKTKAGYIGMIGSRRKCAMIFEDLRKEGFGDADIARVHAPIGLAIEAETPEEIGISIVAEMIQARAKMDHDVNN